MKPIAYGIDFHRKSIANLPKEGGYVVLYKCPKCGRELSIFLGETEKFCHNCGQEISFDGTIESIAPEQSDDLDELKGESKKLYLEVLLEFINDKNKMCTQKNRVLIKKV